MLREDPPGYAGAAERVQLMGKKKASDDGVFCRFVNRKTTEEAQLKEHHLHVPSPKHGRSSGMVDVRDLQ